MIRILAVIGGIALAAAWFCFGVVLAESASAPTLEPSLPSELIQTKVDWQPWSATNFVKAGEQDHLVLLYLAPFWCGPCAQMDRETFSNDKVAKLIADRYFPIRVDPMRRPEIASRYLLSTYPSCVVLTPEGEMVGGSGSLPPDSLYMLLENIDQIWQYDSSQIYTQASKLTKAFTAAIDSLMPAAPTNVVLTKAEGALEANYDSVYGGFGTQPKMVLNDVNEFLFQVLAPNDKPIYLTVARKTLDAQEKLIDSVWGGMYRYARFDDWTRPDYAKTLIDNALSIDNYLDAYVITDDPGYRAAAESMLEYIDRFLKRPEGWGFYHSQQADCLCNGDFMTGEEYFALDDAGRMARGVPPIDSSLYARANCLAVRAYLHAARVLDSEEREQYALVTLDKICGEALRPEGAVYHDLLHHSVAPAGLLQDQIALGEALLDAYETTGRTHYLTLAKRITDFVGKRLLDPKTGGLQDMTISKQAVGRLGLVIRPFDINCEAVIFLARLHHITGETTYRDLATYVVNYIFRAPTIKNDLRYCRLAEAWLWFSLYPIKLALVGEPGEQEDEILQQLWHHYFPREVLIRLQPGRDELQVARFPLGAGDQPRLYVCQQTRCSKPITAEDDVVAEILAFLKSLAKDTGNS